MPKTYNLYHNLGYWFLLLIALVFAGFYTTYFSVILQPRDPVIHFHFLVMTLWMVMLIVQPFLIKYRKRPLHRMIGKISYVLVPLVLISGFLVIRLSFSNAVNDLQQKSMKGLNQLTPEQIQLKAASFMGLPVIYLLWLGIFYVLAVYHRRRSSIHARYMLATALTFLGPTVDRIIFFSLRVEKLWGIIPIETVAFFLADAVLALLLWKDHVDKKPTGTLRNCLIIYISGQVLYFLLPGTYGWQYFVSLLLRS